MNEDLTNDERTLKLLDLFNFGKDKNYIFEGCDWDAIYNTELNEYDCWRLFNFFLEMTSRNKNSINSPHLQNDIEKAKETKEELKENLKMFVMKEETKSFLMNLKHPKKIKDELKLPFDKIFLDTDIKVNENLRIFGIFGYFFPKTEMKKLEEDVAKMLEKDSQNTFLKNLHNQLSSTKSNALVLKFLYSYRDDAGTVFLFDNCLYDLEKGKFIDRVKRFYNDGNDDKTDFKTSILLQKEVAHFMTNVLLFFNEPRVVTYIFERPQKNREKRGLIPIPSEIRTRIHIDLQNYIQKVYFTGQSHSKLGFAFWVIGHYRTLHSNYYIHKKGEKIWIPCHIRGEGLMPPQVFEIVK